jgi:hypothetical protein
MLTEGKMPQVFKLAATAAALLTVAVSVPLVSSLAQQTRAMPEINLPDVVAEVQEAHDRYNDAINAGNIAVINATFHNDDRTIRFGQADIEFSYKEIEAFRAAARPLTPPRIHTKTVITTYGRDFATASTLTRRANLPGKIGRQMQTWVRFPEGWRVVAAHVSTIDEPPAGAK